MKMKMKIRNNPDDIAGIFNPKKEKDKDGNLNKR